MADGKVVIETDLDSSGIEKGLSKIGGLAVKGLSVATGCLLYTSFIWMDLGGLHREVLRITSAGLQIRESLKVLII